MLTRSGSGDAADRRVAQQRHHGVAVAAQHEGGDVLDRDLELLGQEQAEARAVEHARHADDRGRRKPVTSCISPTMASSGLVMTMTKALGACCLMPLPTDVDDLGVDADQVVAAHAGLARHAGGDDDDVGALDVLVVGGAAVARVEALDRR